MNRLAQLDDSAREQVSTWRFEQAAAGNTPVQIESTLTFTFDTKIGNPTPQLSDAEASQQATQIVEAQVPPGTAPAGTKFAVVVAVDENGKILGVNNPDNLPVKLFLAGYAAARQWQFRHTRTTESQNRLTHTSVLSCDERSKVLLLVFL